MTPLSNSERQKIWRERQAGRMGPPKGCISCGKIIRGKYDPFCRECWRKTPDGVEWQRLRMIKYRARRRKRELTQGATLNKSTTTTTKMSNAIAEFRTYNSNECAERGWDVAIYEDFAILEWHTCWQGETVGRTYKVRLPEYVMEAVKCEEDSFEPDLQTAFEIWLETADEEEWQLIRKGSVIP